MANLRPSWFKRRIRRKRKQASRYGVTTDDSRMFSTDHEAVINSDGLLGGKYITLNVGGSELALVDGDELLYTQSSLSILNLLNKFTSQ